MTGRPIAILDPAAGISGDMLLGALVSAGASQEWLASLPARLGFPDVRIAVESVLRAGVTATKVTVTMPGGAVEGPGDVASHAAMAAALAGGAGHHHTHGAGGHHHGHHHEGGAHRHLPELIGIIERADLAPEVKRRAREAFQLLGEAEARVHGGRAEDVALHEVGAIDAVIDIVGTIEGFARLGVDAVYHRPIALGSGWVHAAHGVMPVPAPVTAILAEGMDIDASGPATGEATTPTGAALVRVLSQGPPPSSWRLRSSHWGAGTRNPAGYPNALRLILAEASGLAGDIVILVTDVDDLSPEYVAPLRAAVMAAGALDMQTWATQMKKGRPGFRVEVSCPAHQADAVTTALFRHSSTIGVRRWRAERQTLARREMTIHLAGEPVRIKVVEGPDGPRVKPEYEDIAALSLKLGRPAAELAREAHQLALNATGMSGRDEHSNKEQEC